MDKINYEDITRQSKKLFSELIEKAKLKKGDLLVLGCSTSEIVGGNIGHDSSFQAAKALYAGFYPILKERGIYLAAQCCEHLNRALVVEREYAQSHGLPEVMAVPQPKAGGSSATTAYSIFESPCVVEKVQAQAGIDIGGTLIGMYLKEVAVPLRLSENKIGCANIICAYTRPKYIGGTRAVYEFDEKYRVTLKELEEYEAQ